MNMLRLKDTENFTDITFEDKVIIENTTFVDDPNKIMIALNDILSNRKEISVANICDDYSDNIFVFIRNPWEEKIIIIKNNQTQKDEVVVSKFIDIKELAKTFLNSDLKKYIEKYKANDCYKELKSNFKKLGLAIKRSLAFEVAAWWRNNFKELECSEMILEEIKDWDENEEISPYVLFGISGVYNTYFDKSINNKVKLKKFLDCYSKFYDEFYEKFQCGKCNELEDSTATEMFEWLNEEQSKMIYEMLKPSKLKDFCKEYFKF